MTYRVTLRPLARADVLEACAWYDDREPGLGDALNEALRALIWRIAEAPLSYPKVRGERRRALLRRFRYAVYFCVQDDEVIVLAVMHTNRDPRLWQSRS